MGGNEHAKDIVGKEVVRGLYVPSGHVPARNKNTGSPWFNNLSTIWPSVFDLQSVRHVHWLSM